MNLYFQDSHPTREACARKPRHPLSTSIDIQQQSLKACKMLFNSVQFCSILSSNWLVVVVFHCRITQHFQEHGPEAALKLFPIHRPKLALVAESIHLSPPLSQGGTASQLHPTGQWPGFWMTNEKPILDVWHPKLLQHVDLTRECAREKAAMMRVLNYHSTY